MVYHRNCEQRAHARDHEALGPAEQQRKRDSRGRDAQDDLHGMDGANVFIGAQVREMPRTGAAETHAIDDVRGTG